jgi:hypothetical protein
MTDQLSSVPAYEDFAYSRGMSEVSQILAERFRQIRRQTSGTQEQFADRPPGAARTFSAEGG